MARNLQAHTLFRVFLVAVTSMSSVVPHGALGDANGWPGPCVTANRWQSIELRTATMCTARTLEDQVVEQLGSLAPYRLTGLYFYPHPRNAPEHTDRAAVALVSKPDADNPEPESLLLICKDSLTSGWHCEMDAKTDVVYFGEKPVLVNGMNRSEATLLLLSLRRMPIDVFMRLRRPSAIPMDRITDSSSVVTPWRTLPKLVTAFADVDYVSRWRGFIRSAMAFSGEVSAVSRGYDGHAWFRFGGRCAHISISMRDYDCDETACTLEPRTVEYSTC